MTAAQKIQQCFEDKKGLIFSREITAPQDFTVEDLLECAQLQCKERIVELEAESIRCNTK